jgi:NAD(P)H-dependent FMN reductase
MRTHPGCRDHRCTAQPSRETGSTKRASAPLVRPVRQRPHQGGGQKIASFDGFVIVTPEYNHGTSGVLENALDYLCAEWNNKAVGFVSYRAVGGVRAAEHLRLVAAELQTADARQQVARPLIIEFENFSVFKPGDYNVDALHTLLDQVVAWSAALAPLRIAVAAA